VVAPLFLQRNKDWQPFNRKCPAEAIQGRYGLEHGAGNVQNGLSRLVLRVGKFLAENERLLVVAASTMIMSLSHTALRPVLPVYAKARYPSRPCTLSPGS